ncbi:hypothetical protein ACIQTZ_13800 [Paenarthrobacter sp. NPDC090520]|uniref:hypothetical protein n=1 Tax=Paenarthrobacter sp. NPDC090520 TaxID=3364382 RepID=UPI00381A9C96
MDPIKNQIAAIDPFDPATEPNGEEALHKMLSGSTVYSDTNPLKSVPSLEERRLRKARIAGGLLLGAAAVTAGVLVASNFGPASSMPAPAVTVDTPTPTASATASATPTPSATPSETPTAASTQVPTPTTSAVATAPVVPPVQAPTLKTFTFPDGHLSFTYPAGWTVTTEQGPYLSEEAKAASVGATIFDESGAKVAIINSGMYGDGTAGNVDRTVYDRAVVSGVKATTGERVEFGFFSNHSQYVPYDGPAYEGMPSPRTGPVDGPSYYAMDVRVASMLEPGLTTSGTNQVPVGNGMMNAYVYFDFEKQPTFATPAAAKAWMGTQQYAQLKAMLLSLSYK